MLRGLGPKSVTTYYRVIIDAMGWCEDRGETLAQASPTVVAGYVAARPQTFSTQKAIRSAFIHYWAVVKRKDPPLGLLRLPPRPRMICRALERDEAKILANAARSRGDDPGFAVILGLYQALRREEIATLRWENFDDQGWLTVTGKGGVTASIPVRATVAAMLSLRERCSDYIFPGQAAGRPVTPTTVWKWVRLVAMEAGLSGVTPHRLRHTCLATANDATGDLRSVQAFARHADPRVTAGYTRATNERLRAVVDAVEY
jgi:integrase